MTIGTGRWLRSTLVVAVVSAAMILLPMMQRPAMAQQGWGPAPAPGYGPPPGYSGQPYYAQPPVDAARATMEAMNDAHADTNGTLWFFAGCLLGVIGIIIAYVAEPTPPPARLMGKSPEYLAIYTTTYKSEARSIQGRAAIWGTATAVAVFVVIYIVIIVAIVKSDPTYTTSTALITSP
ncbi:MAG: hypothetical protein ACJ8F1_25430 [Polyangia bacterium]|jgi:hypothetical protein